MLIHRFQARLFTIWRARRLARFRELLRPRADDTILDVGGYPHTWTEQPQDVARIDCLNLRPETWSEQAHPHHRIRMVVGDGCAMAYGDASYPIAFSNSVIEHVHDLPHQEAFAREIRRVGRRVWVQTPAYECPFEPHYLTPFVHWLPKEWRRRLVRNFTLWGWLVRPSKVLVDDMVDSMRLLTKREMRTLFPDCVILTERIFFILPKSYIAYRA